MHRRLSLLLGAAALTLLSCGIDKLVSAPGQPGGSRTPALRLSFLVQPSQTVADAAISPDVQVAVQDESGNLMATFRGRITLTLAVNPSGASLKGAAGRDADGGIAVFDGLKVDQEGIGYVLQASAAGVASALSASFTILPRPSHSLSRGALASDPLRTAVHDARRARPST